MSMNRTAGTLRWQAPELFPDTDPDPDGTEQYNTTTTDIYAYGFVCYEGSHMSQLGLSTISNLAIDVLRQISVF